MKVGNRWNDGAGVVINVLTEKSEVYGTTQLGETTTETGIGT